MSDETPRFVTRTQAARWLGLAPQRVTELWEQRILRGFKAGDAQQSRLMIDRESLETFADNPPRVLPTPASMTGLPR